MSSVHSVSFKIKACNPCDGIQSVCDFGEWFSKWLAQPTDGWCDVLSLSLDNIKEYLESYSGVSVRDGAANGCYGSSTGETYEGLTVYVDSELLPSRFELTNDDGEHEEWFNPEQHFLECGGELLENLDGDAFASAMQDSGLKCVQDNSYNYLGQSSEDCLSLYDFDFYWIENENDSDAAIFLAVMFHCGGDPRGNYGDRVVFKFDSMDDAHSAIAPSAYGPSEDEQE